MSLTDLPSSTLEPVQGVHQLRDLAGGWLLSFSSERTRGAYQADLEHFARFLNERNAGTVLASRRVVIDLYARALDASGLSPATRARRLASLSSFYAYACSVGALESNPAANVKRPKLPNYSPRLGLNLSTAPPVIAAAARLTPEHRALVALCLFAGLRVSEALSVTAGDIRDEAGHKVLQVTSKGGRSDLVPLAPQALRLLSGVLAKHPTGALIRDSKGVAVDRFQAFRMVAALGREAALGRALTPHDLRHGAATCALEAGEPLHRVQQHLRHASPLTTQRYDHSRDRLDKSAAYGLAHALGGVS